MAMTTGSLFDLLEPVRSPKPAAPVPLWPTKAKEPALGGPADPRLDLEGDGALWRNLLTTAFLLDGEEPDGLYGALHGLRCSGARLVPNGKGCRLLPPAAGDGPLSYLVDYLDNSLPGDPAARWEEDRQAWLVPHADVLIPLLRGLR